MEKRFFGLILLCLAAFRLGALDLTIEGGVGNLSFDQKRKTPIDKGEFTKNFYPFGLFRLEHDYGDHFSFNVEARQEPVLRRLVSGEAEISYSDLTFMAGPFFGIMNTKRSLVEPGLQMGLGAEFAGIVFFGMKAGTTIGELRTEGDYKTVMGEAYAGFWLPHIINTIKISGKSYEEMKDLGLVIRDELRRYEYYADMYTKNNNYRLKVDIGYQNLRRSYEDTLTSTLKSDIYHAVFLGAEMSFGLHPMVHFILGGEMPLYTWGSGDLEKPDNPWFFEARAGLTFTLD
jgi:hypothetical protein